MLVFLPGWSWSLYDEISWLRYYNQGVTGIDFLKKDFQELGRIRPLSVLISIGRMAWVQSEQLHWQRLFTYLEFLWLLFLFFRFLVVRLNSSKLTALFGVAFLMKSPPLLELIHIFTLSELRATWFLLLALQVNNRKIELLFLAAAALTKEPFALMAPLAPLLRGKIMESVCYGAAGAMYVGLLYLNSRGVYYQVGINLNSIIEIAKNATIDFSPALILMVFAFSLNRRAIFSLPALYLTAFSFMYFLIVLPL
jgi:hypothetical protein